MEIVKKIAKNIGLLFLVLVILSAGSIGESVVELILPDAYVGLILGIIVRIAIVCVLSWLTADKLLKISPEELGIRLKISPLWLVPAIALPATVLLFYVILPGDPYVSGETTLPKALIFAVFGVGLSAGITEEIVFRGVLFRYMQKTLGNKAAVIVSAVLFACAHIMNMEQFDLTDLVLLMLAGSSVAVMFTFMALKSKSLLPGMITHSLWNALIIGSIFGVGDIVNGAANKSYIIIPVESSSKLLTGGNFGIEAALPGIIGYIIISVLLCMKKEEK